MAKIRSVYICSLFINIVEFFGLLEASEDNTFNIVALHGSRFRLSCEKATNVTNAMCIWKYRELHNHTENIIFNGRTFSKPRIDFDLNGTRCDLIIKDTWLTDAGFYECELVVGSENHRQNSTWLTVMETEPECSMNSTQSSPSSVSLLDGDSVSIECKVVYRGNLKLVMQWNSYDGNREFSTKASMHTRRLSGYNETTSAISIRVTSDQDGDQFICSTSFDPTYFFQNQTNDIKDHKFLWISPKLNVLYGPKSVTVLPQNSIYKVGDGIECLAKSNLETEYHWTELNDNFRHYGSSLVLNRSMVDGRIYKYQCTATSVLKGRNYSRSASSEEISFTVEAKASPRHQMMLFLAGVPIAVTVLCLVLIVVLLIVRRTRQKEIESNLSVPVYKCDQRSVGKISGNSYSSKNEDVGSIRSEGYIIGGRKTQRPCPPCPSGDSQSTKSHKSPVTHTGSDGTVYMDLNTLGYHRNPGSHRVPGARGHPSFPPVSRKIKCDSDGLYAKVDHTQTILPIRSASENINRY